MARPRFLWKPGDLKEVTAVGLTQQSKQEVSLSSHIPGTPYRFRHGWIPINPGSLPFHDRNGHAPSAEPKPRETFSVQHLPSQRSPDLPWVTVGSLHGVNARYPTRTEAQGMADYWNHPLKLPKGFGGASTEAEWKFTGKVGETTHAELLRMRKEARAHLPQGHPERLKAERAVRQSRKQSGYAPQTKRAAPRVRREETYGEYRRRVFSQVAGWQAKGPRPLPARNDDVQVQTPWIDGHSSDLRMYLPSSYDEKARQRVIAALQFQARFIPELAERQEIRITVPRQTRQRGRVTMGLSYTGGITELHPKLFAYDADAERNHISWISDGIHWHPPMDDEFGIVDMYLSHEVGHEVHRWLSKNGAGVPLDRELWNSLASAVGAAPPQFEDLDPSLYGAFSTERLQENYDYAAIGSWLRHHRAAIRSSVSEYAEKDGSPNEFLAELWQEYTLNERPRPAARTWGDYVMAHLPAIVESWKGLRRLPVKLSAERSDDDDKST